MFDGRRYPILWDSKPWWVPDPPRRNPPPQDPQGNMFDQAERAAKVSIERQLKDLGRDV